MDAEQIISHYNMKPLPAEGGYYVETYRADGFISKDALGSEYPSDRNFSTSILYLITSGTCSKLHRVRSDEVFHFYLGDPVELLNIMPDGSTKQVTLGLILKAGMSSSMSCRVIHGRGPLWQTVEVLHCLDARLLRVLSLRTLNWHKKTKYLRSIPAYRVLFRDICKEGFGRTCGGFG